MKNTTHRVSQDNLYIASASLEVSYRVGRISINGQRATVQVRARMNDGHWRLVNTLSLKVEKIIANVEDNAWQQVPWNPFRHDQYTEQVEALEARRAALGE